MKPNQSCTICGAPSTAPLCFRAECLEKWKAQKGKEPKKP